MTDIAEIVTTAKSQPIENNSYSIHVEDAYFLVIGFEVNKSPLTNPNFEEDMEREKREIEEKAKEIKEINKERQQLGEKLEDVPQFKMPSKNVYRHYPVEDDHHSDIKTEIASHNALADPGHTFMYLVKNQNATVFLSVGPLISDSTRQAEYKEKLRKEGKNIPSDEAMKKIFEDDPIGEAIYTQSKRMIGRGTPDYHIPEKSFLFKKKISQKEYELLYTKTIEVRNKILSGDEYYRIFGNNTCAEVVRHDVIGNIIPDLPWGRSTEIASAIYAINPYAFYEQMREYASRTRLIREFVIEKRDKDTTKRFWNDFIVAIRSGENPRDILLPTEKK